MRAKILVIGAALVALAAAGSAQSSRGAASLDDVVSELRGLRADLKAMRATTTEAQMLTVRLQLQEQRIAVLSNQRNEISAKLAIEASLRADGEANLQRFEEMKNRNQDLGVSRAEIEANENAFKQQFGMHRDAEQRLRAQESDLSAQIAAEQNRWQDFNNRLDELERSLK